MPSCLTFNCWRNKVAPHHEKSKEQKEEIEVAKKAALEASKEAFEPPAHLPEYDTEKALKRGMPVEPVKK